MTCARDELPDYIKRAILSGEVPEIRNWRAKKGEQGYIPNGELRNAEVICRFAETFLKIPEGEHVGEKLVLTTFQVIFIHCVFHHEHHVDTAILSIARRNGKTFVIAVIALALLFAKQLTVQNRVIASAAMSKEQAGLLFRAMSQMIEMSPALSKIANVTPSAKRIVNLKNSSEYYAMSADAKTGHGKSLAVLIFDESGQVEEENSDYIDMLITSQGSYEYPIFITISTQAPADKSWLSQQIDSAERTPSKNVVCHVYRAMEGCDLEDEQEWINANPLMGDGFRSRADMVKLSRKAKSLPTAENGFRNLNMNQRVSLQRIWLAPAVWKKNAEQPSLAVLQDNPVSIGLDLSQKNDLTCAVLSAKDPETGTTHVFCYGFTPKEGIEERSRRDKNPYDTWAKKGIIIAVEGATIDYDWVCQFMQMECLRLGIDIGMVEFDRWRINELRGAATRAEFAQTASWHEVGQGFKDMSPRLEAMETALLQGKIRHGNNPILLLGAASAIAVQDPAGSKKLDKSKAANKIDGLVAMVMSVFPHVSAVEEIYGDDISWMIG